MTALRHRTAALAGLTALVGSLSFAGALAPAQAAEPASSRAATCFDPTAVGAGTGGAAAARGGRSGVDHRELTPAQRAAIEKRTKSILAAKGKPGGGGTGGTLATGPVPVYIHVMADANGNGDVTDAQITQQIAELNQDFAGGESTSAANTGFTFTLAGTDRYYNTQWHQDKSSTTYRSQTRLGGANALNIWLVDFAYLGIATFPWDYARNPSHRRHPGAVLLAAGRLGHELQPRQDRHARGRPLVRALPHLPGRLHEHERRGERHPGAEQRRPAAAPRDATPARCRASTRSTTTWTTATTPATTSSPRTRRRGCSRCSPPTAPRPSGTRRGKADSRGPFRRADPPRPRLVLGRGGSSRSPEDRTAGQSSGTPGNESGAPAKPSCRTAESVSASMAHCRSARAVLPTIVA